MSIIIVDLKRQAFRAKYRKQVKREITASTDEFKKEKDFIESRKLCTIFIPRIQSFRTLPKDVSYVNC